jgi:hypothetical protein
MLNSLYNRCVDKLKILWAKPELSDLVSVSHANMLVDFANDLPFEPSPESSIDCSFVAL